MFFNLCIAPEHSSISLAGGNQTPIPRTPEGEDAMNMDHRVYQWTEKDKAIHLLPAIPLFIFYAVSICLLAGRSFLLAAVFILLWFATNVSAVRICAGCPYRGRYCPGLCQLFIAPFISMMIYRPGKAHSPPRSFKLDLFFLGIFGFGSYLFAFCYLIGLYWAEYGAILLALPGLLLLYMALSFFLLCPKCGYNSVCPMAKVHKTFQ
jgi:hypothetical protein